VCAAWPAFAELRGLDRTRNLRCGRCAADWAFSVLRCPFCDERDHRALGALLPGDDQPTRRVETCRSCSGYLKSFTVLRATPSWAIPLEDLSSVPLDLAAHERGFARPERRALRLEIALRAAAPPMAAS
jgi:FdhE protein